MTVTVRDVMPQETRLTIQAKNEDGTWRDLHQLELTRRFGDGAAFSSGSIGYNASGPLQLPDVVGNRVQHTLSCSITETGTKGMFAPKPDAKASGWMPMAWTTT